MVINVRKIFIIFLFILLVCGCENSTKKIEKDIESNKDKEETTEKIVEEPYQDNNHTPISFYELKGNHLEKKSSLTGSFQGMDDIFFLQLFPSNDERIDLENDFADSFYQEFMKYNNPPIKIGFSVDFLLDNKPIHYNILSPNDTMKEEQSFLVYLYDDYINRGKSFYSHIENDDFNESTLFTAIKFQCGPSCQNITSPIQLKVFTYDSLDDFSNDVYRGNSYSIFTFCIHKDCSF